MLLACFISIIIHLKFIYSELIKVLIFLGCSGYLIIRLLINAKNINILPIIFLINSSVTYLVIEYHREKNS